MRTRTVLGIAIAVFALTGCQDPMAPQSTQNAPAFAVTGTGPSNVCYGQIAAGIAATWPWAHDGTGEFPPPPGSLALWIKTYGPEAGISSVRELQLFFCSD